MANRERRRHVRKRVNFSTTVRAANGSALAGNLRDMSLSGGFIELSPVPPFGTSIVVEVAIGGETFNLPATVRWSKSGGVGVQFGSLGARATYLITETLAEAEVVPDSRRPDTD